MEDKFIKVHENFTLEEISKDYDLGILGKSEYLNNLIKRKVIQFGKNLQILNGANDFLLIYEFHPSEESFLNLHDIVQIKIMKEILGILKCHLIIDILDDNFYFDCLKCEKPLTKVPLDKLSNFLRYLISGLENYKDKIHLIYRTLHRLYSNEYETLVSEYKMKLKFSMIKDLFNLSEIEPVVKTNFPCYTACSVNSEIWKKFIPEVSSSTRCIIVSQIKKINDFALCYDASEKMQFLSPILITFKVIPKMTGYDGMDCYIDSSHTLLSGDNLEVLRQKITKFCLSGSRGNGTLEEHRKYGGDPEIDIACCYLKFIEKDQIKLEEILDNFSNGKLMSGEIKGILVEKINSLFSEIREAKEENLDYFFLK